MARVRSPNYPAIGLREAINRAQKVYAKEHTHKAAPEVIAKAMGYGGINGGSLSVMSALKKFGLLEEVGKDLKISPKALTILVDPKDSVDRAQAIREAAYLPVLFQELQKEYGSTLPSNENIRAFLLKRGFSQTAVDAPIRAYRETIEFVSEFGDSYNQLVEPITGGLDTRSSPDRAAEEMGKTTGIGVLKASPTGHLPGGHKRDTFSLGEGQAALEWPENLTADSYEDFESWIQLQLKKIKRSVN